MYVQDIKSPGLNITAELTEVEFYNFKEMCKMFVSATLHEQMIDEYLLNLSQVRSTNSASEVNNNVSSAKKSAYELCESSLRSLQKFKNEIAKKEQICDGAGSTSNHSDDAIVDVDAGAQFMSTSFTKLEDVIKIDEVLKLTRIKMNEILSRSSTRIDSEQEIIDKFSFLLTTFDPEITVTPFGSVTFGFGGFSDFNILITEGKFNFKKLIIISHLFILIQALHCIALH